MASHQHQHHDHDHHGSEPPILNSDSFTDINRKHWDQAASTYSSAQWQQDFIGQTQAFIRANLSWIGVEFLDASRAGEKDGPPPRPLRVLDYACGPGTITAVLQGYATEFVGIDVSENMVNAYNERFALSDQHGRTDVAEAAEAFVGDLLESNGPSESVSGSEFFDFDLAVVGYGFHHFEDLHLATSRLVSRLKPGGVLLIVDFVTHAKLESGDPAKPIVAHHGFGDQEVKSIFGRAGLVDVGIVEMEGAIEMKKPGAGDEQQAQKRKVFLGRGRKMA